MKRAVELYQQGYSSLVIISAGTSVLEGDEWMPEAEVMRRQALALGLPEEAMILETESWSTVENAQYAKQICREHGLNSVLLVTSAYHSRRAYRIFRQVMGPEILVIAQPAHLDFCALCWMFHSVNVVIYEYSVDPKFALRGLPNPRFGLDLAIVQYDWKNIVRELSVTYTPSI